MSFDVISHLISLENCFLSFIDLTSQRAFQPTTAGRFHEAISTVKNAIV